MEVHYEGASESSDHQQPSERRDSGGLPVDGTSIKGRINAELGRSSGRIVPRNQRHRSGYLSPSRRDDHVPDPSVGQDAVGLTQRTVSVSLADLPRELLAWPEPHSEAESIRAIKESVKQTGKEFLEGLFETAVVFTAHCVAPGLGHIVVLFFETKELLEDAAGLLSSDKPVELRIPLLPLPSGIELQVGVQLGGDGENDGPGLIVFFAPGDGGVLHGWGLEREQDENEEDPKERTQAESDEGAIIKADLSLLLKDSKNAEDVAAILRHLGIRLQAELWEMDEYREASSIRIYDERARLGLWLPRPKDAAGAHRIVLEEDLRTGHLVVRLVA